MKFVLASYGTRGDVEPCVAVGRELARRGHEVRLAVSPDQVDFAASAGLPAVAYGPDTRRWQEVHRNLLTGCRNFWKGRELTRLVREDWRLHTQSWEDTSTTLMSLAQGADLLFTGVIGEPAAANITEYLDIPLATLHTYPLRPNSQLAPVLPAGLARSAMAISEWLAWPLTKKLEDAQRRELGLRRATRPSPRRIAKRGTLEIQAYDEAFFPGLAAEWASFDGYRPFVGALTMEMPTEADDEVASWIAAGTPPIFFGFGSMPMKSAADMLTMISAVSEQLGERALVGSGWTDFQQVPHSDHVKVVGTLNYGAAFPVCRAVVHHGGLGTTAAGLRAGAPTLILSTWADQKLWGARVKRLGVGTVRPLSATTRKTLLADLRVILTPQCAARAREFAGRLTASAESVTAAADLMESRVLRRAR